MLCALCCFLFRSCLSCLGPHPNRSREATEDKKLADISLCILVYKTKPPRWKTTLKVNCNTLGLPGAFRKTATLTTDIPGQEKVEIFMPGMFSKAPRQKVQFLPPKLYQGAVSLSSTIFHRTTLTNEHIISLSVKNILSLQGKASFGKTSDRRLENQPGALLEQAPCDHARKSRPFYPNQEHRLPREERLQESVPYNGGRQSRGPGCRRFDQGRPWIVI